MQVRVTFFLKILRYSVKKTNEFVAITEESADAFIVFASIEHDGHENAHPTPTHVILV